MTRETPGEAQAARSPTAPDGVRPLQSLLFWCCLALSAAIFAAVFLALACGRTAGSHGNTPSWKASWSPLSGRWTTCKKWPTRSVMTGPSPRSWPASTSAPPDPRNGSRSAQPSASTAIWTRTERDSRHGQLSLAAFARHAPSREPFRRSIHAGVTVGGGFVSRPDRVHVLLRQPANDSDEEAAGARWPASCRQWFVARYSRTKTRSAR